MSYPSATALKTIRPFFQAAIQAVDPDFREHLDGFNVENIGNSELDYAWHVQTQASAIRSFNQNCLSFQVPVILRAWVKGFRDPIGAVDFGLEKLEAIVKECVRHSRRLNQPFIKNVVPTSFSVDPLSITNDNAAQLTISFNLELHIDVET